MIRLPLSLLAALPFAGAIPVGAQQAPDFSKAEIETHDLGHGTYMLAGPGGNITVVVGADGVILVDGEYAPLHDKVRAAVGKVTAQPVRYLVDTHFHGDHTGGNGPFSKDGATVVAQVNVKRRLADGTMNGLTGAKTAPAPTEALPAKTYEDAMVLRLKDRSVQLRHPKNAHTDGDTYVWIADANVLATGDTVTIGRYPNIDFANGGSINGMIATSEQYLKLVNDRTKIVPGHGPIADQALGATEQQAQNFIRVVYHSLKQS